MTAPAAERTLVVGVGVTGRAVAARLARAGREFVLADDSPGGATRRTASELGVDMVDSTDQDALRQVLAAVDDVVVSPGVPAGHPVHAAAAAAGAEVLSEIELAWRLRGPHPPMLVAVTGTNGKTTVTTLVDDALRRTGRRSLAAGNIGLPLVDALDPDRHQVDVVVAEVSSFQLQFTRTFRPAVACWLNLTPDHLDWHPGMDHYRAAKARIWANQGDGDAAVVNADDPEVMAAAARRPVGVELRTFGTHRAADWWEEGDVLRMPGGAALLPVATLPRALPHDRLNALAAAAVARKAGATDDGIVAALQAPRRLAHRVELVATAGGVAWYDDSKATTPASVAAAVAGFASVVLIAGGRNKGLDLSSLRSTVPPVRAVVAIGEATDEIEAAFAGVVPVQRATSMAGAVAAAASAAEPGDAVVLSPGCTSFDWYADYGRRGDDFAAAVRTAVGGHGTADDHAGTASRRNASW